MLSCYNRSFLQLWNYDRRAGGYGTMECVMGPSVRTTPASVGTCRLLVHFNSLDNLVAAAVPFSAWTATDGVNTEGIIVVP